MVTNPLGSPQGHWAHRASRPLLCRRETTSRVSVAFIPKAQLLTTVNFCMVSQRYLKSVNQRLVATNC
jgi:hypothetical protein